MRMKRFVFLNLSVLSLEIHLGSRSLVAESGRLSLTSFRKRSHSIDALALFSASCRARAAGRTIRNIPRPNLIWPSCHQSFRLFLSWLLRFSNRGQLKRTDSFHRHWNQFTLKRTRNTLFRIFSRWRRSL